MSNATVTVIAANHYNQVHTMSPFYTGAYESMHDVYVVSARLSNVVRHIVAAFIGFVDGFVLGCQRPTGVRLTPAQVDAINVDVAPRCELSEPIHCTEPSLPVSDATEYLVATSEVADYYSTMTVKQLRMVARENDIKLKSKMRKAEIVETLTSAGM